MDMRTESKNRIANIMIVASQLSLYARFSNMFVIGRIRLQTDTDDHHHDHVTFSWTCNQSIDKNLFFTCFAFSTRLKPHMCCMSFHPTYTCRRPISCCFHVLSIIPLYPLQYLYDLNVSCFLSHVLEVPDASPPWSHLSSQAGKKAMELLSIATTASTAKGSRRFRRRRAIAAVDGQRGGEPATTRRKEAAVVFKNHSA